MGTPVFSVPIPDTGLHGAPGCSASPGLQAPSREGRQSGAEEQKLLVGMGVVPA